MELRYYTIDFIKMQDLLFLTLHYSACIQSEYDSRADYEKSLTQSMNEKEWQEWYKKFKPHVDSSQREILKLIV